MKLSTLLWVLGVWLLLNAVFPLYMNALERLYQPRIDASVRLSLKFGRIALLGLAQFLLVVLYAPSILLLGIIERLSPRLLQTKWVKQSGIYPSMQLVLKKQFWATLSVEFRRWRQIKQGDKERPN